MSNWNPPGDAVPSALPGALGAGHPSERIRNPAYARLEGVRLAIARPES